MPRGVAPQPYRESRSEDLTENTRGIVRVSLIPFHRNYGIGLKPIIQGRWKMLMTPPVFTRVALFTCCKYLGKLFIMLTIMVGNILPKIVSFLVWLGYK